MLPFTKCHLGGKCHLLYPVIHQVPIFFYQKKKKKLQKPSWIVLTPTHSCIFWIMLWNLSHLDSQRIRFSQDRSQVFRYGSELSHTRRTGIGELEYQCTVFLVFGHLQQHLFLLTVKSFKPKKFTEDSNCRLFLERDFLHLKSSYYCINKYLLGTLHKNSGKLSQRHPCH